VPKHIAIYISNKENKNKLLNRITSGELIKELFNLNGAVFSEIKLNKFIEEEIRYGHFDIQTKTKNSLRNSSEGERKKALLSHILLQNPDYIVLDNVFDSLDIKSQSEIKNKLIQLSNQLLVVQITTRKIDILSFIKKVFMLQDGKLQFLDITKKNKEPSGRVIRNIPKSYKLEKKNFKSLIKLQNVNVSYGQRLILKNIYWEIKPNEFWQLIGPNGSGKSTILTLISGDNPKGFLQDMTLFGMKKGSGETVWDIKRHIGFFSSEMLIGFKRSDTIENMIISGFSDSIGLYNDPTDIQIDIAQKWLHVLNMFQLKDEYFNSLSNGHKRLVLIARAMVKHPPLLILDEPTNGLDDNDSEILAKLINKISEETNTAIIYVSHRKEAHINPNYVYELVPCKTGSTGKIIKDN
jgi:molybdate transport system ATP-binding protein